MQTLSTLLVMAFVFASTSQEASGAPNDGGLDGSEEIRLEAPLHAKDFKAVNQIDPELINFKSTVLYLPKNAEILAVFSGTVLSVNPRNIRIRASNGLVALYERVEPKEFQVGQKVEKGDVIGEHNQRYERDFFSCLNLLVEMSDHLNGPLGSFGLFIYNRYGEHCPNIEFTAPK